MNTRKRENLTYDFQANQPLWKTYRRFVEICKNRFSYPEQCQIRDATHLALQAHSGQFRADGSPYIIHPIRVALLILLHESKDCFSNAMIEAALLHDAVEDSALQINEITRKFGLTVSTYVKAVTRPRPPNETPAERWRGKLNKRKQLMTADQAVRVIKVYDYLDNVISWKFIPTSAESFRKIPRWLLEAREIYIPLALKTNPEIAMMIQSEVTSYIVRGFSIGTPYSDSVAPKS